MELGKSSCRLLIVVALLLSFSTAICHAERCAFQSAGNEPTITSITPTTWHAGQTIQVTITGNFPGGDQPGCEMNESDTVGQTSDPWDFFDGVGIYPGVTIALDPNDPNYDAGTFTPTQAILTVQIAASAPSGTAYIALSCDGCDGFSVGGPVQIIGVGEAKNLGDPCDIPGCDGVGDPINVASGNAFEEITDYETAGQNKLSYTRYYNSLSAAYTLASELGPNWRSNYDRFLQLNSSSGGVIVAERPDGLQLKFNNTGGSWVTDNDVDYILTQSGSTWTLTDHNDTTEVYSAAGFLQSITLRNGYGQTLTYDSDNKLTTVVDSYNRSLTFLYLNGLVNAVATPDGQSMTYTYNSAGTLASVARWAGSSEQYFYQVSSQPTALTSIMDENGTTYKSWTYDSFHRGLTSQTGGIANANRTTVTYDDENNARTVTNANGETYTYTVTLLQNGLKTMSVTRGGVSTSLDVTTGTETFTYDSNGYLSSVTDWSGNQTTYVNDSHGDPTSITEAYLSSPSRTTTIEYDSEWVHLPSAIITPGLSTSFVYDITSGNLLSKTLTDTTTQSVPYSTNGSTRVWQYTWQDSLLTSVQGPRTDVVEKTAYTYDSGALTGITNPLHQQTIISSHTTGGLPLTIVDPNGVTTNLTYDARQHLLTSTVVTSAGNRTTTYGYDAAENLYSVTQPDGSRLAYTYDDAHRVTAVTDLFGQKISYVLDALGNAAATNIWNASSAVTKQHSNAFDSLGRMVQDIGASSQTSSFAYDAVGNMFTVIDQVNNTTQRSFDTLNRLYKITDSAGGITTADYDAHDRPLAVTAPTGVATAYVYNGFGNLIQESNPNTGTTVFYYDSTGNRIKRVAATGATTQYTYDALDRVLTKTFPSDSAENVTYTYDQSGHGAGIGRLTAVTDPAGTLSRSYDQLGNLLSEARTTGAASLTTAYTYDAANQIASITYPSGATVSYIRDSMGRITSVVAQPNGGTSTPVVSNITYEPFGPYNGLTYGNGVAEARGFDQDYRLTGIIDNGSSATLQNLTYAYHPTNNVQTITNGAASGQAFGSETTSYGYGAGSDLLSTLSVGGTVVQAIGYTADGRIASVNPGIQAPGGQFITSLGYNQDGRLATVNAGGGTLASYTYDGFEQRLKKTVSGSYGKIYQYGQDGMLLEETDASGVAQADYIYLDGRPVAVLNGSTLYYLHDDMLGTPELATDSNQAVQWQANYDPFGDASVSGTITQNLRLPGQYFDVESGWNHNGFRDYAPQLGRYIEPDPLGRLGSGNDLYIYVGDNPANLTDPLGLCPKNNDCSLALKAAKRSAAGVARANAAWNVLEAAANANGIPTALLAAVGVRETNFMNVQEQLAGGGPGPGMGVFQLTKQPGVSTAQAFDLPFSANYAAGMLASDMNSLSKEFSFTPDQLLQATAASYNFGVSNIHGNPNAIDVGTTGGDYGSIVVSLMKCFSQP